MQLMLWNWYNIVEKKMSELSQCSILAPYFGTGREIHHPDRSIFRRVRSGSRMRKRGLLLDISEPCGTEPGFPLSHSLSWKTLDRSPDSWSRQGPWVTDCLLPPQERKVKAQKHKHTTGLTHTGLSENTRELWNVDIYSISHNKQMFLEISTQHHAEWQLSKVGYWTWYF